MAAQNRDHISKMSRFRVMDQTNTNGNFFNMSRCDISVKQNFKKFHLTDFIPDVYCILAPLLYTVFDPVQF